MVYLTETDRWDALIKVANAFSAVDKRGEEETSEEEAQENFIDDGDSDTEIQRFVRNIYLHFVCSHHP